MNNKQIAEEVIAALGGRDNVKSVAHCATRLRVMLTMSLKSTKPKQKILTKYKVLSLTLANTKSFLVQVRLTKFMMKLWHWVFQHHQLVIKKQK